MLPSSMRDFLAILDEAEKPRPNFDAWHGSPHHIEAFSTDFMGSGEGQQAYGWGLYFATHKSIALYYHETLTNAITYNKTVVDTNADDLDAANQAVREVARELLKIETPTLSMAAIQRVIAGEIDGARDTLKWMTQDNDRRLPFWKDVLKALRSFKPSGFARSRGRDAHLYKVELPAGPYLDWDKPFKEQEPATRAALKRLLATYTGYLAACMKDNDPGEVIYHCLGNFNRNNRRITRGEDKQSSTDLLRAGIKGIRYADAASRDNAGGSTSNYVIFNGKDVTIKSRETTASKQQE